MDTLVRPLTMVEGRLLRDDLDAFTSATGLVVAEHYLDFSGALEHLVSALEAGVPPWWWSYLVVDPAISTLVGLGGFKGEPGNGTVEIGYSVAPEHRGRGHATRAVASWLRSAADAGVEHVLAQTLAEVNPSSRVLERCGFRRTATVPDPSFGMIWRWHRYPGAGTETPPNPRSISWTDPKGETHQ